MVLFNRDTVKLIKPMSTVSIEELLSVFNTATSKQLSVDDLRMAKTAIIAYLKTVHYAITPSMLSDVDVLRYLEYLQSAGLLDFDTTLDEYMNNDHNIMQDFHLMFNDFITIMFSDNHNHEADYILLRETIDNKDYRFMVYLEKGIVKVLWIDATTFISNLSRFRVMPFTKRELNHLYGFKYPELTLMGDAIFNQHTFDCIVDGDHIMDFIMHEFNLPRYSCTVSKAGNQITRIDIFDKLNGLRFRFIS